MGMLSLAETQTNLLQILKLLPNGPSMRGGKHTVLENMTGILTLNNYNSTHTLNFTKSMDK
jgi:hypothetical protein